MLTTLTKKDFWKSGETYYSGTRYKSLVTYDNDMYLCKTQHISDNIFDPSKFTKLGSITKTPYFYRWQNLQAISTNATLVILENFESVVTVLNDIRITIPSGNMSDKTLRVLFNYYDGSYYKKGDLFFIKIESAIGVQTLLLDYSDGDSINYNILTGTISENTTTYISVVVQEVLENGTPILQVLRFDSV